jgi:glycosyltransferase involved in cell wall biosynthesis
MTRVLYVHHVGRIAGAEGSLLLLFRHLDRARVTPWCAAPAPSPFADAAGALGVPVLPASFTPLRRLGGVLRSARALSAMIRAHAIDVVHANGPQTNVPAALAARRAGVPVVWHARNLLWGGMRDVDRMLARLATRIVCNADAIRERFRDSAGEHRAVTVMNAIDPAEFHPGVTPAALAGELGVAPGTPLVGLVGRIGLGKGHEHFVDAALALLARGTAACFVIVGDTGSPDDTARVERLRWRVKDAGADDRVRFVGHRRDVPAVMRALDVVVLASDAEPCGRVLFEAAACGTAIVATNTGGTPEIVRHDREALLVPPRDPSAMATALDRLITDEALRARLGRAGAERARTEFSVARHVERMTAIYEELRA